MRESGYWVTSGQWVLSKDSGQNKPRWELQHGQQPCSAPLWFNPVYWNSVTNGDVCKAQVYDLWQEKDSHTPEIWNKAIFSEVNIASFWETAFSDRPYKRLTVMNWVLLDHQIQKVEHDQQHYCQVEVVYDSPEDMHTAIPLSLVPHRAPKISWPRGKHWNYPKDNNEVTKIKSHISSRNSWTIKKAIYKATCGPHLQCD